MTHIDISLSRRVEQLEFEVPAKYRRQRHEYLCSGQIQAQATSASFTEIDEIFLQALRAGLQPPLWVELFGVGKFGFVLVHEHRGHAHWRARRNGPVVESQWFVGTDAD